MKIALIEFNKYHDELFPTWIYILNEIYNNKCSIDIITRKENKEKNVLAYCNFKNVKWRILKKLIFRIMLYSNYVNMYLKKYDILIFNSIEPERIIKIVKRLNRISYAVIHNGIIVQTRESYKELIMNNNMIPIFLSENIFKYCFNTKSNYITPYYLGEKPDEERKIEKVLFLIQGNLSFERKDYVSLIKSAKKLKNEGKSEYFKFMILGNKNNLEDYYIFMELIKEESIKKCLNSAIID
jgi:glycosyltransferase involved in cell wall biosynthesis